MSSPRGATAWSIYINWAPRGAGLIHAVGGAHAFCIAFDKKPAPSRGVGSGAEAQVLDFVACAKINRNDLHVQV